MAEILPLKKPSQTKEEKEQKLLFDVLKPLPKPFISKTKKEDKKETKKKIVLKKDQNLGIILPKKKPLIAGSKKVDTLKKSKYYSQKDFDIAKRSIKAMEKRQWSSAISISKKAGDKSIYKFIQWRHLLTKGNQTSFYDYMTFIKNNDNYPRIGRIRYLAEHKLSTDKISPKE